MAVQYNPGIVTDGLVLYLDAANLKSYSSGATTWRDLSGNNYDFTINASAHSVVGGIAQMNFEGSFGTAKRVVGGSLTDIPNFSNATIMVFSSIFNGSFWRTLTRGKINDHQVIIQAGTSDLGMYDNDGGAFIDSNFDITSLPNPNTQFNCLCFKLSQSSPYYQFQYNNDSTIYSITNVNAAFNNGFCIIGGYHDNSIDPNTSSQYWGKIASFIYYNKHLSPQEIQQNFNALRGRFGI
jgi:hypothetical protein